MLKIANSSHSYSSKYSIACQGLPGSYSEIACNELFNTALINFLPSFESVFSAVETGLCHYGILPIENTITGLIAPVINIMNRYHFIVVDTIQIRVDHCLLAKPGVVLEDVKEIVSHEQALNQCSDYLQSLGSVKLTPYSNTATAAKLTADSPRRDVAAIASIQCVEYYNLNCLANSIQNIRHNYTKFIYISNKNKN